VLLSSEGSLVVLARVVRWFYSARVVRWFYSARVVRWFYSARVVRWLYLNRSTNLSRKFYES